MIKSIIIDDETNNVENLKQLLTSYCPEIEILGEANSARKGIELINLLNPELVFLDIEMPQQTGFDLLSQLTEISFEVIFVTAFNNYALKAIKFNALDYILKPIDINELKEAVGRARKRMNDKNQLTATQQALINLQQPKNKRIALASVDQIEFFEISSIIHCIGENNYTRFFFDNGDSRLVSKPLSEYEDLLSDDDFWRVHKSHLVNSEKIVSFVKKEGGYLITSNGDHIPVSRRKKDELMGLLRRQNQLRGHNKP